MKSKLYRAIGLMSGTSIDGIDAALIETDGMGYVRSLGFVPYTYEQDFRVRLRQLFGRRGHDDPELLSVERELTDLHAGSVKKLITQMNGQAGAVDVIGFHGQTILHQPKNGLTRQIGDGAWLAKSTGIAVVNDFRSADVKAGGQGAPLVPLYHRALAADLPKPLAILNVGGVSNVTWIGGDSDDKILAFDVGPGNAPLDDWILHHTGKAFDEHGAFASTGKVHEESVDLVMKHPFFDAKPPKSLDRNAFRDLVPDGLSAADGAATITAIIAHCVARSIQFMPQKPLHLYVTGGGRLNKTFMSTLTQLIGIPVDTVDKLGWSGDALEAEAFAYLAVRSLLGLPLSVPGTTGVKQPVTGGKLHVT